ncbi:hypothetical protein HYPDE_31583 [Hyphomicrobium denitrificans 1NES1]|uniref:Uncharacterized protein n=1 Tax=Hyphomicrobium denitrificans 1NES1 TaxID=670307 RepID=N0BBW4_9HYPH|nr:hypothetical protein HYPDE_31583 [Hyphomicrobium denitrificans 1NES1]
MRIDSADIGARSDPWSIAVVTRVRSRIHADVRYRRLTFSYASRVIACRFFYRRHIERRECGVIGEPPWEPEVVRSEAAHGVW